MHNELADKETKVSVIIPVYNSESCIAKTMESVLSQTLKEIEVICIDDGSTDNSLAILRDYAAKDSRLIVLTQPNSGAAAARNKGMRLASGTYLSILDADDIFDPTMLEVAYELAERQNAQVVVFGCDNYYEEIDQYSPCLWSIQSRLQPPVQPFAGTDVKRDVFKLFVGWAWDKLFLRSFVEEWGLRFQEQRTTNDLLFVFSSIVRAERIATTRQVLCHHRRDITGLSTTREKSWHCFYDALTALRQQLKDWDLWERFERDYINYCLHACLWNLNTLAEPTRSLLLAKLKEEWFQDLGISTHDKSYFYNAGEYSTYLSL